MVGDIAGILLRRAITAAFTLFLLVTALFFFLNVVGNPLSMMMGDKGTAAQAEAIKKRLGLDKPLPVRYVEYVAGVVQGDLGTSWKTRRPVMTMILERVPATLLLGSLALLIAMTFAVPIGLFAALRPGSWIDNISRVIAVVANSVPSFWLAILLIIIFAVELGVLPATGRGTWKHLVLPSVVLATASVPLIMRVTRSAMLEVLNKDYVRTARSKGLSERIVIGRHALRNAMIPVTTVTALRVGEIIGGTIIIETVFAYPGVGRVTIEAMTFRDYPVVIATVGFVAAAIMIVTLITDVLYTFLDPRIRLQ
jgi:ABC-type dipeptide/oligopeptide/nickel transport system permease component